MGLILMIMMDHASNLAKKNKGLLEKWGQFIRMMF